MPAVLLSRWAEQARLCKRWRHVHENYCRYVWPVARPQSATPLSLPAAILAVVDVWQGERLSESSIIRIPALQPVNEQIIETTFDRNFRPALNREKDYCRHVGPLVRSQVAIPASGSPRFCSRVPGPEIERIQNWRNSPAPKSSHLIQVLEFHWRFMKIILASSCHRLTVAQHVTVCLVVALLC